MAKRIEYLDYTKAIGMLLIILAHTTYLFPEVNSHGIPESCHVPIFFIAVGLVHAYFPYHGDVKTFVVKRLWGVFVPYIIFSVINSILKIGTLLLLHNLNTELIYDELFQLIVNGNGPVWFLGTLFFADILYIISNKYAVGGVLSILLCIVVYYVGDCNNKWIYPLMRICMAYSLIVWGEKSIKLCSFKKAKRYIIFAVCLAIWILLLASGDNCYAFRPGFFLNPLHSLPLLLSGSYMFLLLSTLLPSNNRVLNYIGKNSLGFLVIHPTLHLIWRFSIGGVISNMNNNVQVITFCFAYLMFLLLCWPINEFINKYIPIMYGKKNGSRN